MRPNPSHPGYPWMLIPPSPTLFSHEVINTLIHTLVSTPCSYSTYAYTPPLRPNHPERERQSRWSCCPFLVSWFLACSSVDFSSSTIRFALGRFGCCVFLRVCSATDQKYQKLNKAHNIAGNHRLMRGFGAWVGGMSCCDGVVVLLSYCLLGSKSNWEVL